MPSKEIGRVHYTDARAVRVRDPEIVDGHSAVHGNIAVYVDTLSESNALIARWPDIIAAAEQKVNEILIELADKKSNGDG